MLNLDKVSSDSNVQFLPIPSVEESLVKITTHLENISDRLYEFLDIYSQVNDYEFE